MCGVVDSFRCSAGTRATVASGVEAKWDRHCGNEATWEMDRVAGVLWSTWRQRSVILSASEGSHQSRWRYQTRLNNQATLVRSLFVCAVRDEARAVSDMPRRVKHPRKVASA